MATSSDNTFFDDLIAEYHQPFNGWDFSYLIGRRVDIHQQHFWDYTNTVTAAMKEAQSMLDMRTGGGERLAEYLGIQPVPEVYATEGYAPNVGAARERLVPFGVTVYEVQDDRLPLSDASLDLIINRHGSYDASEVQRVLRPIAGCTSCWVIHHSRSIMFIQVLTTRRSGTWPMPWANSKQVAGRSESSKKSSIPLATTTLGPSSTTSKPSPGSSPASASSASSIHLSRYAI